MAAESDVAPPKPIVAESALLKVVDQAAAPARVAGLLASLNVKEGDVVAEGELLGNVDDVEAELIVQRTALECEAARQRAEDEVATRSAEKSLLFAQEEHQRLKRAAEGIPGSVSKSELAESRVAAEKAALDVEKAKREHELDLIAHRLKQAEHSIALHQKDIHKIASPVHGMVVELLRRRGEWVEPGEDVLRIVRLDRLWAEGLIAFQEVEGSLQGAEATIVAATPESGEIAVNGRVVFVHPEINPVSGRIRVRAEFDNPGGRLMPGMRVVLSVRPVRVAKTDAAAEKTPVPLPGAVSVPAPDSSAPSPRRTVRRPGPAAPQRPAAPAPGPAQAPRS